MNNQVAFLITCLTDLHAGSGDTSYGFVDKTVQRDAITNFPTIFSTSLKGALREHFEHPPTSDKPLDQNEIIKIFGSKHSVEESEMHQGNYRFFGADLLVLPVRNDSTKGVPFYRATCYEIANRVGSYMEKLAGFSVDKIKEFKWPSTEIQETELAVSTEYGKGENLNDTKHLGSSVIQLPNNDFRKAAKNLPIRARNQLDNGKSENLWYEEFVPRESRFVFFVRCDEDANLQQKFVKALHNKVIQFGANASVGMGFCLIEKID